MGGGAGTAVPNKRRKATDVSFLKGGLSMNSNLTVNTAAASSHVAS